MENNMTGKVKRFIKKHKRMLIFIPVYILYLVIAELILGLGGNDIWDHGEEWMNKGNEK